MHLLKYFKELTVRPKNSQELKGLILQLAIQGKLTANWRKENPDIEPASVLLKRISKEKARLIKEKKIKKEKPLPSIAEDEIPNELPESWICSSLGSIVLLKSGITFNKTLELSSGDYMYVKVGAMNLPGNEEKITTSNIFVNSSKQIEKALIPSHSIIFPKRGGAIATNKKRIVKEPILVDLNTMAIICPLDFEFMYLRYWFDTIDLWKLNNGTSVPQINNKDISPLLITVPPLIEQNAIVGIVNQLFVEVEQLEALTKQRIELKSDFVTSALRKLTTGDTEKEWTYLKPHFTTFFTEKPNIKKLRESILQLAVQGKLTSTWRASHPELVSGSHHASELLKRIKVEKEKLVKTKKIKKEKPLPEITKDEFPYELPEGWVWCRFQDVFKDLRYGTSKKCDYNLGPNPVLRIPNISQGGIDISDLKTTKLSDKEINDLSLFPGDLLIIRSNGSENIVGRSAVVSDVGVGYSFAGYLVRLQIFINHIESNYLYTVLESKMIRTAIEGPLRTTSGVKNINSTEISSLIIPIPSREEQKIIVQKVNALLGLCDELEQQINISKATQENWMKSALREVFESNK